MTDTFNSRPINAELTKHTASHYVFPLNRSGQIPNEYYCISVQAGRTQRAQEGDDLA